MTASAGQLLRADIAAMLAHAVKEHGPLELDELERRAVDQAAVFADRAEALQAILAAELASEKPGIDRLAKLSAEHRHCCRASLDLVRQVANSIGAPVKSERHVRASRARWDRTPRHGA